MNFISVSYASGWKVDPISARQNYNYKVGLMAKGEGVYNTNCAGCHQKDGTGMPPIFPAIKNSAIVNGDSVANISIVLHGKGGMPTFKMFDDENLAAVITYTRNAFGNTGSTVKPSDIKSARLNYNYLSLAESNTPTTVYITNMVDIPMRSSNKIEREPSNLLKMLPSGTQLTVLSTENGWTKVKFKNTVGWIISRYLKHVGQKTYITDEVEIPMRSSNKIERDPSNLLRMLPSGTKLEILVTKNGWSKVKFKETVGWIISRYLTNKKPAKVKLKEIENKYSKLKDELNSYKVPKYENTYGFNAEDEIILARLYRGSDVDIEKDLSKSFQLLLSAANSGHAMAQSNLGVYYVRGYGTDVNYKEAYKWYLKAAKQKKH